MYLELAHETYLGVTKTKLILRDKIPEVEIIGSGVPTLGALNKIFSTHSLPNNIK